MAEALSSKLRRKISSCVLFVLSTTFNIVHAADPDHFNGFRYPGRPPWQFGIKSPDMSRDFRGSTPTRFSVPHMLPDEELSAQLEMLEEEYRRNYRPPRFEISEVIILLKYPSPSESGRGRRE
jgi:hypothetical protein